MNEFLRALENPPPPNEKLKELMRKAHDLWDETVKEPVPPEWIEMLSKLK